MVGQKDSASVYGDGGLTSWNHAFWGAERRWGVPAHKHSGAPAWAPPPRPKAGGMAAACLLVRGFFSLGPMFEVQTRRQFWFSEDIAGKRAVSHRPHVDAGATGAVWGNSIMYGANRLLARWNDCVAAWLTGLHAAKEVILRVPSRLSAPWDGLSFPAS